MITCHRTRRREAIRHNEASNTTKQSIKYNVMFSLLGLRHKWWNKDRKIFSLHRLGSLSRFTRANAHLGWWAIFHLTVNSLFQKIKWIHFFRSVAGKKKGYIFAFLRQARFERGALDPRHVQEEKTRKKRCARTQNRETRKFRNWAQLKFSKEPKGCRLLQ